MLPSIGIKLLLPLSKLLWDGYVTLLNVWQMFLVYIGDFIAGFGLSKSIQGAIEEQPCYVGRGLGFSVPLF